MSTTRKRRPATPERIHPVITSPYIRRVISDRPFAYSYRDAAQRMGVSLRTIERLVQRRELVPVRIGQRRRVITEAAIAEYLARAKEEAEAERMEVQQHLQRAARIADMASVRRRRVS
jgi:excisionase family DNA binding protein